MSKNKTGNKWCTSHCSGCGCAHLMYSGKIDSKGIEYVVCGQTGKRMNVSGSGQEGNSFAFSTEWIKQ